jgi:hypothetical protein
VLVEVEYMLRPWPDAFPALLAEFDGGGCDGHGQVPDQVTVDDELAGAMARIDPAPASRSRLVRDLALRGAQALEAERVRADEALAVLIEIADGVRDYDLGAPAEVASRRPPAVKLKP